MWLLLVGCSLPGLGRPTPDLAEEMRSAAADDPRLVQCLLPRLDPLDEDAMWRAARTAANARGHDFASVRAYREALDTALTRWVVSPAEAPGSRAEQNRWLCTAGRGVRSAQVAERLAAAGSADRADLRLFLLAATGEVPWPETTPSRFVAAYRRCWDDMRAGARVPEGERAAAASASSIGVRHARTYATPPDWTAARDVVSILADLAGFFAAGRPSWDGLEGLYVAELPDATVVLAGGGARCHLSGEREADARDLVAWRIGAERWFQRVSLSSARGLDEAAIIGVRGDGDTIRVDTATGSTRYRLEQPDRGCVPGLDGPSWYLEPVGEGAANP